MNLIKLWHSEDAANTENQTLELDVQLHIAPTGSWISVMKVETAIANILFL